MGDLRAWSPERNGVVVVLEGRPLLSPSVSSSSVLFSSVNPEAEISSEYWQAAEVATQGIIARVQPTAVSEERRRAVIHYVQRLIKNSLGCEVFPFGSVPLKTYLPDGDIDLTAFGGMSLDEALANDVCSVLEREDKSGDGKFVVKDVQLIRAEVKLVKCLVQNIVVDISFNQLGGLCTLCFLEQVDRLIGKDHLFKRSITLVKAWCYYESRILGAHHGLISTYALETLVLYIFHLFHLSLNGPLAVLFKFLDYFSKFDWDNYCVSLNGPIRIGSLPEVVVEAPENTGCDLLLTNDFLNDCAQKFSVPVRGFETNSRTFPPKHLNIVDPLKENNNLGRSVSKGNFYRIRSAFTYGARKLGRVLSQPEETVGAELCKFFSNTLDRHGSGQRPDVQDPLPVNEHCESVATPLPAKESCPEDWTGLESSDSGGITADSRLDIGQSLQGGIDNVMISESEVNFHRMINETQSTVSGPAVSENHVSGDAKDLATSRIQGPLALDKASKSDGISSMGRAHHAPHLYLSFVDMKNGELRNGNTEWKHPESTSFSQKRISSWGPRRPGEEKAYFGSHDLDDNNVINMLEVHSPVGSINHPVLFRSVSWSSDDRYAGYSGNQASGSSAGKSEALNSIDLTGDYESHLNNLYYGRCWYECAMNGHVPSMSPPLSAQFQGKSSWDVIRQSMQYTVKGISKMNVNGVASGPVFYPMKPQLLPSGTLGMEEKAKPRGTGTYFPNMNHYKDRPTTPRGRGQTSMRSPCSNGRNMTFQETYFSERQTRDSQIQLHFHQGGRKPVSSDLRHPAFTETKPHSNVNGSEHPSEVGLEFRPAEHLPNVVLPAESDRQPNSGSASTQSSGVSLLTEEIQIPKPALGMEQDGIAEQSYQLKDDDFPPLSDSSGKGWPIYLVKKHEEQNGES